MGRAAGIPQDVKMKLLCSWDPGKETPRKKPLSADPEHMSNNPRPDFRRFHAKSPPTFPSTRFAHRIIHVKYTPTFFSARIALPAPGAPGIQKKYERKIPAREIRKSRTYVKETHLRRWPDRENISGKTLFVFHILGHSWPVPSLLGGTFAAFSEPSAGGRGGIPGRFPAFWQGPTGRKGRHPWPVSSLLGRTSG